MSVLSSSETPQSPGPQPVTDDPAGTEPRPTRSTRLGRFLDESSRQMVFRRLRSLSHGSLAVVDADGRRPFGPPTAEEAILELHVRDPRFYRDLVSGGSLGAAEAYLRGYWDCDRLVDLLRLFCRDTTASGRLEGRLARWVGSWRTITHRLRRNTPAGSRRNIAAHYDLGDDFFSLFLDKTMAYSCGVFANPQSTLREASLAKFERVCRKLQLSGEDHVLEIGSGWGGFAVHAAQNYGCCVTTTTISKRQYNFTLRRVQEEGLADRVTVLCKDYRKLTGQFDKLVSIEMIEAVGYEYFDTYFQACSNLLKADGMMLLQAITIPDQRFDRYRRSVDFIQRYVFPGGCLPSLGAICGSLGRVTDMRPVHLEDLAEHYARTLQHWRRRFQGNIDQVRALGFSEEFLRLWHFYFCYCEAGFRERQIGDVQIVLAKPACRRVPILPPLSA